MANPLAPDALAGVLPTLPGWRHESNALTKTFKFHHFREAMSFLVRVAFEAEALNHHPEIHNVYGTVTLRLTTHDAGNQVTQKDVDLAQRIEHLNWLK